MRWQQGRRSTNVEDRRGSGGARFGRGGTIGGGSLLLLILLAVLLGENPLRFLNLTNPAPPPTAEPGQRTQLDEFVDVMLASTEDVWEARFQASGSDYREPILVKYDDTVQSACGYASAATGPFYCPGDQRIFLDLGFLGELQRLGVEGDFGLAYVIAHEVGHHVQTLTGTERQVRAMQARSGQSEANALSVRMELQADCYAGVWAHHANRQWQEEHGVPLLEPGDVQEGLNSAAAIGDDRLQRGRGRVVQPESFTHGTSEQRASWFSRGLETGDAAACDTFGG